MRVRAGLRATPDGGLAYLSTQQLGVRAACVCFFRLITVKQLRVCVASGGPLGVQVLPADENWTPLPGAPALSYAFFSVRTPDDALNLADRLLRLIGGLHDDARRSSTAAVQQRLAAIDQHRQALPAAAAPATAPPSSQSVLPSGGGASRKRPTAAGAGKRKRPTAAGAGKRKELKRAPYMCWTCGKPKKGHVCTGPPQTAAPAEAPAAASAAPNKPFRRDASDASSSTANECVLCE